jgi:hypothetical protein
VWCQTSYDVPDKNNNIRFEGFSKHFHQYHTIGLSEIFAIMSVLTFKTNIILNIIGKTSPNKSWLFNKIKISFHLSLCLPKFVL